MSAVIEIDLTIHKFCVNDGDIDNNKGRWLCVYLNLPSALKHVDESQAVIEGNCQKQLRLSTDSMQHLWQPESLLLAH
ncbi:hypothetical protein VNO78_21090 [Psophocarpus tetragonolobus]|uniref:Uncharacterized protein n=1 Tax=Psophocarpus tetragonolobus TaxID=3891 RepID=A0AAN9XHU8_PSOTE